MTLVTKLSEEEPPETLPSQPSGGPASTAHVVGMTVLAHADTSRVGAFARITERTEFGRLTPRFEPAAGGTALPLNDPFLSRRPILLGSRAGEVWINRNESPIEVFIGDRPLGETVRVSEQELQQGVLLRLGERTLLLLRRARLPIPPLFGHGLHGLSAGIQRVREDIQRVAALDVPVLIRGESGVGKELVARALHKASRRANLPYEAINLASIAPSMAGSELFGHEKGAFTGAVTRHLGCFARTHRGTLFLDEVGDAPPEVQAQLLRVLETRDIRPVGATNSQLVDVRLIAATEIDLDSAISRGTFREAVFQRLAGYQIAVPALRTRPEDLAILFHHFVHLGLRELNCEQRWKVPASAPPPIPIRVMLRLLQHDWPGNVRQLRNVTRQLVIRCSAKREVVTENVLEEVLRSSSSSSEWPRAALGLQTARDGNDAPVPTNEHTTVSIERSSHNGSYLDPSLVTEDDLVRALTVHDFRIAPAAKALGVSRTSLYALMEQSTRVRKAADLSRAEIEEALNNAEGKLTLAANWLEVSVHALKLRVNALGIRR